MLHGSRSFDFVRLYRLGYHHKPGDFREQEKTYASASEAVQAAGKLNQPREQRGLGLFDTVCLYVRLGHMNLPSKLLGGVGS